MPAKGKELLAKIDKLFDGKVNIMGGPVEQNWTAEPYVLGSYTFPAPEKYRKQLSKPIGGNDEEGESSQGSFFVGYWCWNYCTKMKLTGCDVGKDEGVEVKVCHTVLHWS